MPLVTLAEVKSYLTISGNSNDANLNLYANYASAIVESYCGRNFESAYVIEYHDGGRSSIFANRIPINNVNAVYEYDGVQYVKLQPPTLASEMLPNVAANNMAIEYTWESTTGQLTRSSGVPIARHDIDYTAPIAFSNYKKGVKIEYNGGYDTIPLDIKTAVLDYVKMLNKQESSMQSASFQSETKQATSLSANFPAHIRRILDLYRII
jgi:hypothetical protein